jgi:hypothetical protein
MTLIAMNIPDEPGRLADWLERHLTGLDLGALVSELSVVHGQPPRLVASVRQVLGDALDQVLERGLHALPPHALRQLLRQPHLLLELQELVLSAGSPYWDRLARGEELDRLAAEGLQNLRAARERPATIPFRPSAKRSGGGWGRGVSLLMAAAAVLLAVFLGYPIVKDLLRQRAIGPGPTVAWGWAKPGAIPTEGTAPEYLNHLADSAEEWFNKKPDNAKAVAQRIEELRQGCKTLIAAEHKPLAPADRDWLVERCRKWLEDFDKASAAIVAERDPVEVRTEVDATVRRLIGALRDRATKVAAG